MRNSLKEKLESVRFINIEDLYERKEEIRLEYRDFSLFEKEIYKWYFFYELSLVRNSGLKADLWDFLNDMPCIDLEWKYKSFKKEKMKNLTEE